MNLQTKKNYPFRLLKDKPRGHKQIRPNWFPVANSKLLKNRTNRPLIHDSATKTNNRLDQSGTVRSPPTRDPSVSIVAVKSERHRATSQRKLILSWFWKNNKSFDDFWSSLAIVEKVSLCGKIFVFKPQILARAKGLFTFLSKSPNWKLRLNQTIVARSFGI